MNEEKIPLSQAILEVFSGEREEVSGQTLVDNYI